MGHTTIAEQFKTFITEPLIDDACQKSHSTNMQDEHEQDTNASKLKETLINIIMT